MFGSSENVDPKQDYNHAKFENSIQEKGNIEEFSNEEICQLSPSNTCKHVKMVIFHDLLDNQHQSYNVSA